MGLVPLKPGCLSMDRQPAKSAGNRGLRAKGFLGTAAIGDDSARPAARRRPNGNGRRAAVRRTAVTKPKSDRRTILILVLLFILLVAIAVVSAVLPMIRGQ